MSTAFRNLAEYEVIYSGVVGAEISEDIVFTTRAMDAILEELKKYVPVDTPLLNNIWFVRLLVNTVSPAYERMYSIAFDNVLDEFDRTFELRKIKIVINRRTLFYFMGIMIDYVENETESGFVFKNISNYYPHIVGLDSFNETTNEATVETNEATVETSEATVETSEATVETSEATVETSEATVETNEATVETNEATVETNEATVETSETTVETSETTVETNEN